LGLIIAVPSKIFEVKCSDSSLLHNKILILFCGVFVCVVLLMLTPQFSRKAVATAEAANQLQTAVILLAAAIMPLVRGFGSLPSA
jgi:hypothetical protein